jgi:hypothetical protein
VTYRKLTVNYAKLFACAMIALQVGACIAYAAQKDYRRATYWFGAIVVTAAVTF